MKLKRPTSKMILKRALDTLVVKVLISYIIISICRLFSYLLSNRMGKNENTDNIASTEEVQHGFLVCWLSTLAQQHLRIIKTEDAYAIYSEDISVSPNFYLIKTTIEDKINLRTVPDEDQTKCISFRVRICSMAYCTTRYNRFVSKTKVLLREYRNKCSDKWFLRRFISFKPQESVRRLDEQQFSILEKRAGGKRGYKFWIRSLESVEEPIELKLELMDALPCGISQFEVTPILLNGEMKDIDGTLWKCVFDEVHQFFHDHHFPPEKSLLANKPVFHESETDIRSLNNPVIRHYISTIGEDLINQLDDIYRSYQILLFTNKTKREKGQKKISNWKLMESAMSFFESCDTLLGVHAFLNSVINSPQNTKIVLSREISKNSDIPDREIAMRIDGAYKGTIALMQRISHHHDFRNNRKSLLMAIKGIKWSIAFGVLGLILSLVLAYDRWHNVIGGWLKSLDDFIISFFS